MNTFHIFLCVIALAISSSAHALSDAEKEELRYALASLFKDKENPPINGSPIEKEFAVWTRHFDFLPQDPSLYPAVRTGKLVVEKLEPKKWRVYCWRWETSPHQCLKNAIAEFREGHKDIAINWLQSGQNDHIRWKNLLAVDPDMTLKILLDEYANK